MFITGYKIMNKVKVPMCFETKDICAIRPYCEDSHYWEGRTRMEDNVITIYLNTIGGQQIGISDGETIMINGVPVTNDSTENAIKIIEHFMLCMNLETTDPPVDLDKLKKKVKK